MDREGRYEYSPLNVDASRLIEVGLTSLSGGFSTRRKVNSGGSVPDNVALQHWTNDVFHALLRDN